MVWFQCKSYLHIIPTFSTRQVGRYMIQNGRLWMLRLHAQCGLQERPAHDPEWQALDVEATCTMWTAGETGS